MKQAITYIKRSLQLMKRLLITCSLLLLSLSLTACASFGKGKTEPIKDETILNTMNQTISEAVSYYFDLDVPNDVAFEYQAFKSLVPSPENKKDYTHHSDVFQATRVGDAVPNELYAYGGILSPDNTTLTGLVLSMNNEKVSPQVYSMDELETIAVEFLKEKELLLEDESISLTGKNEQASSTYMTVLNFSTDTRRYAVGINLQYGNIVYFEHAPLN